MSTIDHCRYPLCESVDHKTNSLIVDMWTEYNKPTSYLDLKHEDVFSWPQYVQHQLEKIEYYNKEALLHHINTGKIPVIMESYSDERMDIYIKKQATYSIPISYKTKIRLLREYIVMVELTR